MGSFPTTENSKVPKVISRISEYNSYINYPIIEFKNIVIESIFCFNALKFLFRNPMMQMGLVIPTLLVL